MPDAAAPCFLIECVDASNFEAILHPIDSRCPPVRGPHAIGFATLSGAHVSTRAATVALLSDLYVQPDHRGGHETGVGTVLPHKAAREAGDRGFSPLNGETAPENRSAQALYDRSLRENADPGVPSTRIRYSYPLPTKGEQ